MSQQVEINYEHIACQCNCICELAQSKLQELDKMLTSLDVGSSTILDFQSNMFKSQLKKEKESLTKQIKLVKQKAETDAKIGVVHTDNHDARYARRDDAINEAKLLQNMVNTLSSEKLIAYEELLKNILGEKISENYKKMLERSNGVVIIPSDIQKLIDSIKDEVLAQFAYVAYVGDNTLSGDKLIAKAKLMVDETYESRLEQEQKRIRDELTALRLDKKIIDTVVDCEEVSAKENLIAMQEKATTEIVGEKIRQHSIKIIINAVSTSGFIVDKKNIKIDRELNEVKMVAVKASGEKAEFKVYLDGRFIYDFHDGYEGQACQKDIEPFIKDLEEVYGMHITKSQEIWNNPDKLATMKYQSVNTNKNKR